MLHPRQPAAMNVNIQVFRSLRPWVKFDIYNLFDNQKVIARLWRTKDEY